MIYFRGMKDCLQCSKPLVHVPGRKEKSFCDVNCRNKYFYAQRKKQILDAKAILVSFPADSGGAKPLTFAKPNKKPREIATVDPMEEVHLAAECSYDSPRIDEGAIREQIKIIKAEKCPAYRNTSIGKKSWEIEQKKRIKELENKLNQ
jgi:hypothetical protein